MRGFKVLALSALLCPFALGSVYAIRHPGTMNNVIGPGSIVERALARLPFVDKVLCLGFPQHSIPFDSMDKAMLKQWIPNLRYVTNPEQLAVTSSAEDQSSLRQRFVPSDRGSLRVVLSTNLKPSNSYEVEQSVMFEPNFDWGGEVESGKFGFGFAGGSAPTGGTIADDGFSARLLWKGNGDGTASAGAYLYSVDRTQNLPYGDEFVFPNFTIPTGEWFNVKIRLTVNSLPEASDGQFQVWINEELEFDRRGIQWQSADKQPVVDQVLYSSFHGGNTDQWSPENVTHAQVKDVCVYKKREEAGS